MQTTCYTVDECPVSKLCDSGLQRLHYANDVAVGRNSDKSTHEITHTHTHIQPFNGLLSGYGHVLQKDDDDWVKKCMEHEVEGSRPRGRPKKT